MLTKWTSPYLAPRLNNEAPCQTRPGKCAESPPLSGWGWLTPVATETAIDGSVKCSARPTPLACPPGTNSDTGKVEAGAMRGMGREAKEGRELDGLGDVLDPPTQP